MTREVADLATCLARGQRLTRRARAQVEDLANAADRLEHTVFVLRGKWHESMRKRRVQVHGASDEFQAGMRAGWVQAISELTGVEFKVVIKQLEDNQL